MSRIGKILVGIGIFIFILTLLVRIFYQEWDTNMTIMGVIGLLVFATAIFYDFGFYKELFAMKTTKHGLSMGAVVLIFLILLVAVNFIASVRNKKWDLTSDQLNSLSDQSISILKGIDQEIEFRGFFRFGADEDEGMRRFYENLVRMYQAENSKVKLFTYDYIRRKDLVERYKILTPGEVIISIGSKQTNVSDISEQTFTSALLKLTRNTKRIYFLTGHGERDPQEMRQRGVAQYKKYLEEEGYEVQQLNIAAEKKVPTDGAALAILGPTAPLADAELTAIREYLSQGGKVFLTLDPGTRTNADRIAEWAGVQFENKYIQDLLGVFAHRSANYALGLDYLPTHQVTGKMNRSQTIFPLAAPLKLMPGAFGGITVDEIIKTDASAFTVNSLAEVTEEKPRNTQKFTLVAASRGKLDEKATKEFSFIVAGDSDFITNEWIDVLGANRDFALNVMAFLSNDSEMITIRPKMSQGTPLFLTSAQEGMIKILVGAIPLLMFGMSFGTWWRRRGA